MNRRALLATLSTASLAGCPAGFGDGEDESPSTPTVPPEPPTPVSLPERPADLTDDRTVAEYLREYEYATIHNGALDGSADVTSVEVGCDGAAIARTDAGAVGFAVCTGGIFYADGTHGDLGNLPSAYYVAPDRTVRIDGYAASDVRDRPPEAVFAAENPAHNVGDPEIAARGVRLYNFDHAERRVTVSVRYLGDESSPGTGTTSDTASPTLAFESTYLLEPRSVVVEADVAVREGEYRVDARLSAGPAATYRWRLAGFTGSLDPAAAVTPGPDVVVGPVDV